uniref:O-GlcNAc transferase C-terminal domain-containing protein n=1 Tax=viral metagenome TaxID=1070528 RepID=A0A6C0L6S6_9ZZZZ
MKEFVDLYNIFLTNQIEIYANKHLLYNNMNISLNQNNDINAKIFILEKMITLFPEDYELYYRLGKVYKGASKEKELFWYKLCFSIKPDYPDNFFDLCDLLLDMGFSNHVFTLNKNNQFDKFMKEPKFLTVYIRCNLVNLKYENGLKCLIDLIKINASKPCITDYDKNEKWRNYHDAGYLFCAKCDVDSSIKHSEKAYELSLKFNLDLQKKLLSFQNILCFSDYKYCDNDKLFNRCLEINKLIPDSPMFSFKNRIKSNRIRIGYLSSDFIMHSVSNFILPILRNHDQTLFEIFIFANSDTVIDSYQIPGVNVNNISNIDNKSAAKLINNCKIDILVDLNGHTVKNKLEIFTYHPAPIQITYLGFPNTTGLKSIKYRITDVIADNPLTKQKYSEELIRLPKCFLLFDPIHPFKPNPRKTKDKIVLGAINKENKSNDELLKLWGDIMRRCPNAVILFKLESYDDKENRTKFYMDKLGMSKDRLIVLNKLNNEDYEKVFTLFDILLDPFPYSGTTTTCNALYNSIPVVTLYNPDYHVNNVSSSLLINCGFPELVANSKEEYLNIVVDLVNNPKKIDEYKKTILGNFMRLMEPKPFMNSYENELKRIYNNQFEDNVKKETGNNDTINITISEEPIITKPPNCVYICGCVKNCGNYLEKVFANIDKIIPLFSDYKLLIAHDICEDNSLDLLKTKHSKYKMELICVTENNYIKDYTMRSKRISNARNEIIKYIYSENNRDFKYFIMMDLDDVCSGNMNIGTLKTSIDNDIDWDSLSFNRPNYYDIWGLSIDQYLLSCWHFPGGFDIINKMKQYIVEKLSKLKPTDLLECTSAFNGFAIYKKDKFAGCYYDWQIHSNFDLISKQDIERNEKALGVPFTIYKSYHKIVNPVTDCEHRYFHMSAIEKNDARIRISPHYLFTD